MVWPKSGCSTSSVTTNIRRPSARLVAGISGRRVGFREQPGNQDDERGLEEFRRLDGKPGEGEPAARALDFGAEQDRENHHRNADREDKQRQPADLVRIEERGSHHHGDGRQEEHHVPVDEIERLKPQPGGNRGTGGQREHDTAQHQGGERPQHQLVDSPPPLAEGVRVARETMPVSPNIPA